MHLRTAPSLVREPFFFQFIRMRKTFYLLVAALMASLATQAQNWTLEWNDEFNGTSLNLSDWNYDLGTGSQYGLNGWGNNELQYYREENVSVGGGMLTITALEQPFGGMNYTSGKIHTKTKQTFSSGKIEARIKVPVDQGMWPAFWLLTDPGNLTSNSAGWPPEIDVFESVGTNPSTAYGTLHAGTWPDVQSNGGSTTLSGETLADDFHIYTVEWYNDHIVWFMDGVQFHEVNAQDLHPLGWQFDDVDWFLILNLAVGGNWPGSPDGSTNFPATMEVDYVRVYSYDAADLTDVTFRVDMSQETLAPTDVVYVNGNFNDWCGTCNPMTDMGDGTWETTLPLPVGVYEYKYTTNGWAGVQESFPAETPCAVTTYDGPDVFVNRGLSVQWDDQVLPMVCFNSCDWCPGFSEVNCTNPLAINYNADAPFDDGSCEYAVTFNVDMSCEGPASFTTPSIEGPSTGWCGSCVTMADPDGDNIWSVTLTLPVGDYEYKYAHDNWAGQEDLLDDLWAGNGGCVVVTDWANYANRSVSIPGDGLEFDDTYNTCTACVSSNDGCMDVNACNYDASALSDDGSCVHATGCDTCSGATDGTGTVVDNPGVGEACDDGNGATLNDTIQADCTCAGQLTGCTDGLASNYDAAAVIDDGSCEYAVTFHVDMNCEGPAGFTAPAIEGPLFGWCGSCVDMTDPDNDGIFTRTITLAAGAFEYKYAVDNWTEQENLLDDYLAGTGGCVDVTDGANYANRVVNIPAEGLEFNDIYGRCGLCAAHNVTFQVDMSGETVSPNGVHIAGSFNGNDPAATPMASIGLGVYQATVEVAQGSTMSYRFVNGNTAPGEEVLPPACETAGYRTYMVGTSDEVLPVVCFEACEACAGCTDPFYLEFNPLATTDDGSCMTPVVWGCVYETADNYDPAANTDDGSCIAPSGNVDCPEDLDGDGSVGTTDLLTVLAAFGADCP